MGFATKYSLGLNCWTKSTLSFRVSNESFDIIAGSDCMFIQTSVWFPMNTWGNHSMTKAFSMTKAAS